MGFKGTVYKGLFLSLIIAVSAFTFLDLDLCYNQISELPNNLFKSLVNLENLDLGENEITNIPNGLFDNLISLKLLGLIFNKINLKRMSLCKNKIEFQEDIDPNIFNIAGKTALHFLIENKIIDNDNYNKLIEISDLK